MVDIIKGILFMFDLGYLKEDPTLITGGITNKIYKVVTMNNKYAIKIINNDNIINDKNLINRIEMSENIADKARLNGINSICALKLNGKFVNRYKDVYFLIYKWCDGKILSSKDITNDHLKLLANQMASLHNIEVIEEVKLVTYKKINYNYYYNLLTENNEEWAVFFKYNYNKLEKIYDIVYENYRKLGTQVSYVHRDLNRKNILWEDDIPYIIDWETATIANPSLDFFNSAWFLTDDVKEDKYKVFTAEYLSNMDLKDDLKVAIYSSIIDECRWLEFSLKRALTIHSNNPDEIELGKCSIIPSLNEIINYYNKTSLMIEYSNDQNF